MAKPKAFINNAIAQLFDEIEEKCKVKFATFTASDLQGQKNLAAGKREFMDDTPNDDSHGIYKYLYDPNLAFDFRFHQRLAAAPFVKTKVPWVTIMFSTKQPKPLTNILSHKYTEIQYHDGLPYELKVKRVSVPVNMALVSNDMNKLYETAEKMSMYFDRFINFHYDHVIDIGNPKDGGFQIFESKVGQAADIREVDLTKLDTEHRGSLVSEAYTFNLVYFVVDAPDTSLHILKKIILEIRIDDKNKIINIGGSYDEEESGNVMYKTTYDKDNNKIADRADGIDAGKFVTITSGNKEDVMTKDLYDKDDNRSVDYADSIDAGKFGE